MGVDAQRDRTQTTGAVVDGIHAGHDGQEDLRRTDVGRGLLAADVLLTRLEGKPVCRRSRHVDGDSDEAPGQGALESGAHGHVAGVRATEAHRHTETLRRSDRDVGAPLPRRRGQGQRHEVGGGRDERAGLVGCLGEGVVVAQAAVEVGVLDEDTEDLAATGSLDERVAGGDRGQVGDDDLDAQRARAGLHDGEGLREGRLVHEQHRVGRSLARAAHERHRLGRGRGLVEERGAGRAQPGEVPDDGLEVEERLESPLGDLGLIGRVCRVPGGVLEDVALDDGRRDGAVVAQADHRGEHLVAGREAAQLLDDGELGLGRDDAHRLGGADGVGNGGRGELVEAGAPDGGEHLGDLSLARADVALREGGQVAGVDRGVGHEGEAPGTRAGTGLPFCRGVSRLRGA